MKIRTPYSRDDLRIKKRDRVLEIGPGQNPSYRSDVLVEKYVDSNYHRGSDVRIYPHQKFVNGDGENLPFKDNEFDYVICNQVLEHVEHPEKFVKEMCRVARRGYLETPSFIGEYLFPKKSHKWVILDVDGKLVMYEKAKIESDYKMDFASVFLNYFLYESLPLRLLDMTEEIFMNRYEWKDEIEVIVNPTEEKYLRFFNSTWNNDMVKCIFPSRSVSSEIARSLKALCLVVKRHLHRNFVKRPAPMLLNEYFKLHPQE